MPTLRIHKTPPGPRARALLQRMQQCVAPSATHPYPLVVDHASGCYVWDVDGNCYLDFTAGIAVSAVGHGHKQVLGSIKAQADRLLHFSFADFFYPSYVHLAERLAQLAPGRDPKQVFLCNSGAEAIEAAIKLPPCARSCWMATSMSSTLMATWCKVRSPKTATQPGMRLLLPRSPG